MTTTCVKDDRQSAKKRSPPRVRSGRGNILGPSAPINSSRETKTEKAGSCGALANRGKM